MTIQPAPFRSRHAEDNGFLPRSGFEPFEMAGAEQSIVQRFSAVARRRRDAVAVVAGPERISYLELLARASAIGSMLQHRLGDNAGPVVIQLPSGVTAIEALLGVLYSGRSYLFLPMGSGSESVVDLLVEAAPSAQIVADDVSPITGTSTGIPPCPVIAISDLRHSHGSTSAMDFFAKPGDVACLFATSGTTGTPKLVGLSHRAVLFDVGRQINDLYLGPDDRIDLLGHPSFSASLASIFTALLTGAELHVLDSVHQFADLGTWLKQSGITISTMTVSTLRALCATLPAGGPPRDLRLVSVGGEPLLARDVAAFRAAFPAMCVLQNAMASTETRTYAQYFVPRASAGDGPVPIGWPVFAKEVEVLGPDGSPVAAGQYGEFAVRSCYLADGYANSATLSAARFLPQPDGSVKFLTGDCGFIREDGCLMFTGRVDSMVKIRGNRVEPGSVEAALVCDSRVRHAAVVVHESSGREPHLVAYVVLETPATAMQLLNAVASRLPAYAVPSELVMIESLPVTRNGKIDYQALKDLDMETLPTSPGLRADHSAASLLELCSEVLGHPEIRADDSFFECGGDSLNAIRLQLKIHRQFGVDLPIEELVRHPTMNALAQWLTSRCDSQSDARSLVLIHPGAKGPPLFCVPGIGGEPAGCRPLAEQFGDRPVYGLRSSAGELHGPELSIEGLAAEYLRAISTVIAPGTPVLLCGHSFGAIVAFEMAHQLKAAGRPLGLLAIIDMPLPSGERPWWTRASDVLLNLPAWLRYDMLEADWKTLVARSRGKLALIWRQVRPGFLRGRAGTEPDFSAYFGNRSAPPEMKRRLTARLDALGRYRLRPLAAPIVMFRARAQALFGRNDRYLGWQRLAEAIDVCDVPGHHDSCTHEPHVRHMAELLSDRLDAVKCS